MKLSVRDSTKCHHHHKHQGLDPLIRSVSRVIYIYIYIHTHVYLTKLRGLWWFGSSEIFLTINIIVEDTEDTSINSTLHFICV